MSQSYDKHDQKVIRVLKKVGYIAASKIAESLQGSIWRASPISDESLNPTSIVIKVANKYLQQNALARVGKTTVPVHEDVISEAGILKYLTEDDKCPKSIVRFHRFFKTSKDYFLMMEDGGSSLFKFVTDAHKLIQLGKLDVAHWREVAKIISKQMLEVIEYIHSKNVCHFDLSLENFLINDPNVEIERNGDIETIRFITDDIQIKLCDFGLAKYFKDKKHCLSTKYCGKNNYKSPEVLNKKKKFDAKQNDIWCFGVILFMTCTGVAPWNKAHKSDEAYNYMTNGFMKGLLKSWDILEYVDDDLLNLFEAIFQDESHRISLNKIKDHPFMK